MLSKTLRQRVQRLVSKDFFFFNVRHPLLLYIIYIFYRVLLVLVLGCVIPFKFGSTILFSFFLFFFFFKIIISSASFPYNSYFLIRTILEAKKFESSRGAPAPPCPPPPLIVKDYYQILREYTSSRLYRVDPTHYGAHLYVKGNEYTLELTNNFSIVRV